MPQKNPWIPLRTRSTATGEAAPPLPGRRGRYLLYLGPPAIKAINGKGRYVHFSWRDGAFVLRDYIAGVERREGPDMTVDLVWRRALDRIPATGKYFVPHSDATFWKVELEQLTEEFQVTKAQS